MELAKIIMLGTFSFLAVFATINSLAYISNKANEYKANAMAASICWAIVLMLMRG